MIRTSSLLRSTTHPFLQIPEFLQITPAFWKDYNQKRFASVFSRASKEAKLYRLEENANLHPNDPTKQAQYLEALNEVDPHAVVRRYDTVQFAKDENVHKQYLRALQSIGNVRPQYQQNNTQYSTGYNYPQQGYYPQFTNYDPSNPNPKTMDVLSKIGTPERPLTVSIQARKYNALYQFFQYLLFLAAIIIAWSFFTRAMQDPRQKGKGGGFGGFLGGTEFKPILKTNKTFTDVKGIDECKDEIMEIVEFLKHPDKFTKLGGKLPKGVLLVGQPGTGKTLLAKAIAGEAGVPFFFCAGSEFDEMFVGVGAQRVRSLFAAARKHAPCIIFIDEIDSLGGKRTARDPFYSKQSLNQLLTEMDGFNASEGIIVIGATNFLESLDKALIRPGRFDKQIEVPLPDLSGRKDILQLYLEKVPVAKDFSVSTTAQKTMGFSGADLENLINIASIRACTKSKNQVSNDDIDYAFDRIVMGIAHKTKVDEEDKLRTAYHEIGHALMVIYSGSQKKGLHKVTVIPRGRALGFTASLPTDDSPSVTKQEYLADIDKCLGGIVAEEIIYGRDMVTSGASSDLKQATRIARAMVTKFGMSDRLGLLDYSDDESKFGSEKWTSEDTRREIDIEIRTILQKSYEKVKKTLLDHEPEMRRLTTELVKYETLSGKEVKDIIAGKKIVRDQHNEVNF